MSWVWLSRQSIEATHHVQLRRHGGLPGLPDENAFEAAIARPQNKVAHEQPDVHGLAAAYLYGLARNHPFNDGNKRTAIVAAGVFLGANGFEVTAENGVLYEFVMDVAAGLIGEDNAACRFHDFTAPRA